MSELEQYENEELSYHIRMLCSYLYTDSINNNKQDCKYDDCEKCPFYNIESFKKYFNID